MKLDLGSGQNPKEGYTSVDRYYRADMMDDIRFLPSFKPNSVEEIYSCHALEHVRQAEIEPTLRKWYEVLQPDGKLVLIVPDLPQVLQEWLVWRDNGVDVWQDHIMARLFGSHDRPGQAHKSGFDASLLHLLLMRVGFIHIKIESVTDHKQPSLKATAVKSS